MTIENKILAYDINPTDDPTTYSMFMNKIDELEWVLTILKIGNTTNEN